MLFDELMKEIIKHPKQGYALYYYHDGEELEVVNGKLDVNKKDKITFDSNFRLASVTKQFIAYGIVKLIKKGLLSYETTIKELFSDLPDYFEKITIKNLLNHTSGLFNYEDIVHDDDVPQIQDDDILPFLENTENTYFETGTIYRYSNTAYVLLGLIIKKISGVSLGEYFNKIFKEARMDNSVVNYEGETVVSNRAYGHLINDQKELYLKDQYWTSATIGDGGIYSSVNDLKKWCKFLVETEEFKDMRKPNPLRPDENSAYGLGIRIIQLADQEIFYHCGSTIGTSTLVLFSIDFKVCLIFLSNLGNVNTSGIKDNVLAILKNK